MSSPVRHTDHRESAPGQASGEGIRIRNLNKSFGKKHVLRDIAVDFAPDRVHGLLGATCPRSTPRGTPSWPSAWRPGSSCR